MLTFVRILILSLLVAAAPVQAAVRVLLIGINQYQFSVDHDSAADPKFHDLQGAVNDVETMRRALVGAGAIIAPMTSGCRAATATSTILTDACARRADIFGAWGSLAAASVRGDTLVMYYSGHGSTVLDTSNTQESGSSDTIVPYDARGRALNPEIIDLDLKALIDTATARGVNVVTVFDSCNSGTATRAFSADRARAIPRGPADRPVAHAEFPQGANPGYRVHLSAAADGQTAIERAGHGLFTGALAAAIAANPLATYGDLVAAVRLMLAKEAQTPGAEGALVASFLGPPPPSGRYFTGHIDAGVVTLKFGTLSLVTPGSRFAIYASATAAAARGAVPLATGTVTAADTHQARIVPAGALPITSGDVFVAELSHDYESGTIRVALSGTSAQQAIAAAALAPPLPVTIVANNPAFVVRWAGGALQLTTSAVPPTMIYDSKSATGPAVTAGLQHAVRGIADYQALLQLQQVAGVPKARLRFFTGSCAAAPAAIAPAAAVGGEPTLIARQPSHVMVANLTDKTLYSYLFALNHDFRVFSLNEAGADKPIVPRPGPSRCQTLSALPGRGVLFAVLSEQPLDAAALAQNGDAGGRGFGGCDPGALAYLLCTARRHTRDFGTDATLWTVAMSTTNVVPLGSSP